MHIFWQELELSTEPVEQQALLPVEEQDEGQDGQPTGVPAKQQAEAGGTAVKQPAEDTDPYEVCRNWLE